MANFSQPTALPARTLTTVLSAVLQVDCMVDAVHFVNNDTSDRAIVIKDGNGKVFEKSFTVPAGTRQQLPLSMAGNPFQQGVFFSGGIQMSAAANDVIDMWISARTQG